MRRLICCGVLGFLLITGCRRSTQIRIPAVRAILDGVSLQKDADGTRYADGFLPEKGSLTFHPRIRAEGIYKISIQFRTPEGGKGYTLTVNGVGCDGFLPASPDRFQIHPAGRVRLPAGKAEIRLEGGWGHYQIAALLLEPAGPFPAPRPVSAVPVNPQASPEAQALMQKLAESYGSAIFSGAMSPGDIGRIEAAAGVTPALVAGDLMEDSPSRRAYGAPSGLEVDRMLITAAAGHMITLCWHWNAPSGLINQEAYINENGKVVEANWWSGFYTRATTFDLAAALADPGGGDYQLLLRDIDVIALQLRRLQEAGVPVLWRPLHEADGGWFWWGAQGPEAFKALWRLMYQRLVGDHQLNNLLWVYTWSNPDWYPGDDVVDLVGMDLYPSRRDDLMSGSWARALEAFDGRKLIGLSELGSAPNLEEQWALGIRWAYFVPWNGMLADPKVTDTEIREAYTHPAVINGPLNSLPER